MTITDSLPALRTELKNQLETMDGIANEFKIDGENVEVSPEQATNYRKALAAAEEIKGQIDMLERGTELKSWFAEPGGQSVAAQVAAGMGQALSARELKSIGELFTASDEFKALGGGKNGLNMAVPWSLEVADLGGYNRKDVFTASAPVQSTLGFGRTQFDPMVPRAQRQARVRDLFPAASTDANLIDYFRIIGFGTDRLDLTSGARPVRERAAASDGISAPLGNSTDVFGLKPKSNLRFESAQAPVRLIAHYEVAHRNVLADEPQLQSTINNELLYGLRLEEDRQILQGDGTGENLLGILNTPNIQTYIQGTAPNTTETKADAMRRAATKAILAYYPPSGYVLHPYDWEDVELTKATGDGQYVMFTNVSMGAESRAWRQPVVESPAMPEGTFLTGAWGLGAQLYDRQQANIRIADQHADFFIRNAVAILAEMRLALAVKRPESFVKGTFS